MGRIGAVTLMAGLMAASGCYSGLELPRQAGPDRRNAEGWFLLNGQQRWLSYEIVDGQAIFEGDVLLADEEDLTAAQLGLREPDRAAVLPGSQWPDGVVPFVVDDDVHMHAIQAFADAMAIVEVATAVRFVPWSGEADYVRVVASDGKCRSYIGRQGGQQTIELDAGCISQIAVHELGHALGMFHEQSRIDRDEYIEIHWENIKEEEHHNFATFLELAPYKGANIGPYDFDSIMHYHSWSFTTDEDDTKAWEDRKPTITKLDGSFIWSNSKLSPGDIAAIDAMYPPPITPTPCGDIDWHGRCEGQVLQWCEQGALLTYDCSQDWSVCGWQDPDVGYNCLPI